MYTPTLRHLHAQPHTIHRNRAVISNANHKLNEDNKRAFNKQINK